MWIARLAVLSLVLVAAWAQQEEPGLVETAIRFMGSCGEQDLTVCLKARALNMIESASGNIELAEGITIKKEEGAEDKKDTVTAEEEKEDENGAARGSESYIDNKLFNTVANFLETHSLEFKLPKETVVDMKRSLEEARKKKKKKAKKLLLSLLLLLKLKAALILPLIFGAIAFIAVKALIVGKIALVISLVSAIKKLLKGKMEKSYEVVAHPQVSHSHVTSFGDEHHGHYVRSIGDSDPHNLAYSAYAGNH